VTTNDSTKELLDKIDHCPALTTINVIAGKWKTRILWLMRNGELGFNELRRSLKLVSAKVLTDQLKQLEQDGVVYLKSIFVSGVRVSRYGFTEYGTTLIPLLDAMGQWGLLHEDRENAQREG